MRQNKMDGRAGGFRSLSLLLLTAAGAASGAAIAARDPVPDGYVAAPYYPAPHGGWADDWAESYAKAVDLVSRMTLAEKTNITAGTGQFMGKCPPPLSNIRNSLGFFGWVY